MQAFVYETKRAFIRCYMIKYLKDSKWKNYSCLFNFNILTAIDKRYIKVLPNRSLVPTRQKSFPLFGHI